MLEVKQATSHLLLFDVTLFSFCHVLRSVFCDYSPLRSLRFTSYALTLDPELLQRSSLAQSVLACWNHLIILKLNVSVFVASPVWVLFILEKLVLITLILRSKGLLRSMSVSSFLIEAKAQKSILGQHLGTFHILIRV